MMDNISMLIEYEEIDDILKVLNAENPRVIRHFVKTMGFGIKNEVKLLPIFELKSLRTGNLSVVCLQQKNYRKTLSQVKNWAIELEEFEAAAETVQLSKIIKKVKL